MFKMEGRYNFMSNYVILSSTNSFPLLISGQKHCDRCWSYVELGYDKWKYLGGQVISRWIKIASLCSKRNFATMKLGG